MKKFSLLLMIVLIVGAIFISCSAEPSADASSVANVAIDFPKALSAETHIDNLPGAETLTWKYTAVKVGGGFTTGATGVETPLWGGNNTVLGLPGRIGEIANDSDSGTWFSIGNWKFSFFGYDSNNILIYKAEDVAVEVNRPAENSNSKIGGTANITLSIANDPRGNCKVKMDEIFVSLGNGYVSDATYTLYVYDNGTALDINGETEDVDGIVGNKSNSDKKVTFTYSSDLFSYEDSGLHLVKFEVKKNSETLAYASGEIGIWARKGYTWTISGELDSLDSHAQVGIHVNYIPTDANQTPSTITISSEEELRAFASFVNQGNSCEGLTIKLTSDITLTSAWTPIGNSYRGQVGENDEIVPYFAGTFDGDGHSISGLSLASDAEVAKDSNGEYVFGLFGVVKNATIQNLTMTNVKIDRVSGVLGENVAAVVGYSEGSLTLYNITVGAESEEDDSYINGQHVAGIISRAYGKTAGATISITNCINYADITATNGSDNKAKAAGIAAFVVPGYTGASVTITDCENYGTISSSATTHEIAAGIASYGFSSDANHSGESITINNNTNSAQVSISNSATMKSLDNLAIRCSYEKDSTDTEIVQHGN